MLQIITEKFFQPGERYETLHRAVFFTNYRVPFRAKRIETLVGTLLPTTGLDGVAALTCEILEKIEKNSDPEKPGILVSTGGASLLNDFAAVTAFGLNITCTPDPDLTRRLIATDRPHLGSEVVPSQLIKRTFDKQVIAKEEDGPALARFIQQLVGLERKRFEASMRALQQYVIGLHRVADNISLAYTQLVMSIESLAQSFSNEIPKWTDYDSTKRERIDGALDGAPSEVVERVRIAILENEHIAAARRFRDFALSHVAPSFFRDEAAQAQGPIAKCDLPIALQQAYKIRSRYAHTLREIPRQLTIERMPERISIDDQATLSLAGIARLARHIITQYVYRSPVVDKESFDYARSIPNIVEMELHSHYWISRTDNFKHEHGPRRLSAQIEQIIEILSNSPDAKMTDIRLILAIVERTISDLQNYEQRLPLVTMYYLFHWYAGPNNNCAEWPELLHRYKSDFDPPSIESFVAHLLTGLSPDWTLSQLEELHMQYFTMRHQRGATKIGRVLEAALSLFVAEANRAASNESRALELVAHAVESHPDHVALRNFESGILASPLPEIKWEQIMLPANAFRPSAKSTT